MAGTTQEPTVHEQSKTLAARREKPDLEPIMTKLRHELHELYPMPLGPPHPFFPRTYLQYLLLTETQLDNMASYYHQRPMTPSSITAPYRQLPTASAIAQQSFPSIWTDGYPAPMERDEEYIAYVGETQGVEARVRIKRRKFGKFIGISNCFTPTWEAEDRHEYRARKDRIVPKGDEFAFWGRRGRYF